MQCEYTTNGGPGRCGEGFTGSSCGEVDCGCMDCWDCNACDTCKGEED